VVFPQLASMQVQMQHITFNNTTMESEKYICVRETGATNQLLVVEVGSSTPPTRRPITADSAIMNPNRKIIALKAAAQITGGGNSLQVFDLDTKTKLKAFAMGEAVTYWRWISPTKIGMVTASAVYHWDIEVTPSTLSAALTTLLSSRGPAILRKSST